MIIRQYAPCSLGRSIICLGKQGEINALRVEFDVSAWMAMYPDATVKLMHFAPDRPQDNPVIPTLGVEGTLRVWIVGEEDTAGAGNGVIELLLIDERTGSTIKSATGYTTVLRSPSAGIEAQEAEAGYVRYDVDQSALLTDEQKAMARKNIGAGTGDGTGSGGILKETDPTVPDWAKQPSKPTYTASEVGARPVTWTPSASDVGADAAGTASGAVAAHNVSGAAHADLRALIEGLNNRLNALADSDDTTLDQLSEIVAYIKSNKSLIDAVTTGKVSVSDIVDNLTTNASGKVLSAAQGVALKAMIDGIVIPTALPNPQPITINGQRYDGSEAVTVTVNSEGGGTPVEIDDTLTQSGQAADAKAVGDRLSALNEAKANNDDIAQVSESITEIIGNNVGVVTTYNSEDLGLIDGTYIRNGEEKSGDGYSATGFLAVSSGIAKLHLISYSASNRQVCMYDSNRSFIGNAEATSDFTYITGTVFDITAVIPIDCAYIRFSVRTSVEGHVMKDGNIYHVADVTATNSYTRKLYLTPDDSENLATKEELEKKQDIPNKMPLFIISFDLGGDRLFNADENGSGASRFGIVHDEYGLPFTASVQIQSNGVIDLSVDNAQRLENAGCDLCLYSSYNLPYTVHGNDITTYYNEQYSAEWKTYFNDALDKLNAIGGFMPTAWCCRYNHYGSALEKPLKELGFLMVRGNDVQGDKNTTSQRRIDEFNENSFMANTQTIQMSNLSEFLAVAQDCIDKGNDYLITTHALYPTDEQANAQYSLTPTGLRNLCAWLKDKQDNGLCKVVTMREYARIRMGHIAEENDYLRIVQKINHTNQLKDTNVH